MSEFNITVQGGKSIRLPVAGKYCDRDIVVTAEGGSEDLDAILAEQEEIIANLKEALQYKASSGDEVTRSIVNRSIENYADKEITSIGAYAFSECATLVSVNMPATTSIGAYAFSGCTMLSSVNLPLVTKIASYGFSGCTSLKSVDLPNMTLLSNAYTFSGCSSLVHLNAPKVVQIGGYVFQSTGIVNLLLPATTSLGNGTFRYSALQRADLPVCKSLGTYTFDQCASFTTLILRASSICKMLNANALTQTPIASGAGYIYVPSALVDSYKSATNWSNYAEQIRAIEDYPEICG